MKRVGYGIPLESRRAPRGPPPPPPLTPGGGPDPPPNPPRPAGPRGGRPVFVVPRAAVYLVSSTFHPEETSFHLSSVRWNSSPLRSYFALQYLTS